MKHSCVAIHSLVYCSIMYPKPLTLIIPLVRSRLLHFLVFNIMHFVMGVNKKVFNPSLQAITEKCHALFSGKGDVDVESTQILDLVD